MSMRPDEPEIRVAPRSAAQPAPRVISRRVDPGLGSVVVASAMLLLLVAALLPWIGTASGFEVLRGSGAVAVGVLPRLFAVVGLGFGVVLSALALLTRRWALVLACALGCGYSVLDGMWAIWSSRTSEGPGPGFGLVLAELALVVLTVVWVRLAGSRR